MTTRVGGSRHKSRSKFSKDRREKGKISLRRFLQGFTQGDKVILKANTAYQKGMYIARFHGKPGIVQAKRGECYEVAIKDNNKAKSVIIHPVHLKKQ